MKLVIEGRLSAKEVGRRLNVSFNTISNWVGAHRQGKLTDVGKNQRPLSETELELARLRRELAQVKMERDILGSSSVLCKGVAGRYAMIKELRLTYRIPVLCKVLDVSESGYYARQSRPLSKRAQEEGRLEVEIQAAHKRNWKSYGPERLQEDLKGHGLTVGVSRISESGKSLGFAASRPRSSRLIEIQGMISR